jgi:hypothetical protein
LRQRLRLAIAQAWGEQDPAAAIAWALAENKDNLQTDLKAVLAGAVDQPSVTLEIGRELLAENAPNAGTFGALLVDALSADGQFQAASQFASDAPADYREDWTATAYRQWAQSQPAEAAMALDSLSEEGLRDPAFRAVVQGWSASQPSDLAAYALSYPPGNERAYAFNQAMLNWSQQDPAGLSAWLLKLPPGSDYDTGAFFLVTGKSRTILGPDAAISWAESIGDLGVRLNSFQPVLEQWAQTDPMAAQNYVEQARWLDANKRLELLQTIHTP